MIKTTMGLVWHNCLACPPKEEQNMNLYMTDGQCVIPVAWIHGKFFYEDIPLDVSGDGFWWADFIQTTKGYFENRNKPSLMEKFCPPGYWQGDCKKCWESKVINSV